MRRMNITMLNEVKTVSQIVLTTVATASIIALTYKTYNFIDKNDKHLNNAWGSVEKISKNFEKTSEKAANNRFYGFFS